MVEERTPPRRYRLVVWEEADRPRNAEACRRLLDLALLTETGTPWQYFCSDHWLPVRDMLVSRGHRVVVDGGALVVLTKAANTKRLKGLVGSDTPMKTHGWRDGHPGRGVLPAMPIRRASVVRSPLPHTQWVEVPESFAPALALLPQFHHSAESE
jgi:hypothetical protein